MKALNLSATDSSAFLHSRVRFPTQYSKTGYTTKSVSRYLKQTVSSFYTQVRQTVVKVFVDIVYTHSNSVMGKPCIAPNAKRARIALSKKEALSLLDGNAVLEDMAAWRAFLDALEAVFNRVGAGETFSEASPMALQKRHPVCLLSHVTLVMTKFHEHLKRVAGVTGDES